MYLHRSGFYSVASAKDFQDGVIANLTKLESTIVVGLREVNIKIDSINNKEITDLKVAMARLETQVKIYAAMAAFVGMAVGGALVKFIVH